MEVESSNEVKRMEIDRQRDELSKKTDENARKKEAAKREHENQMAHQKLDQAKEMDKTQQTHREEIDSLEAEIKEKKKNIEALKEKVNAMKSEIAQEKANLDKKIDKTKEEKKIFMEKKLAEVESDNHDEMIKKKVELTQAQEEVKNIQHDADMAKVENERNLEQQREEERLVREQTVNSMKEEFAMKDRDFQRQYTLKDAEHKAIIEELNKKKESDFVHLRDLNRTEIKQMTNDHQIKVEELTAQIKKTQKELEAATSEMAKQLFDHQHDLKIKLADQERETEQAYVIEANEKLVFWRNDVQMRKKLMDETHEQNLAKVKFQIKEEEQKAIRAKDLNFELGE